MNDNLQIHLHEDGPTALSLLVVERLSLTGHDHARGHNLAVILAAHQARVDNVACAALCVENRRQQGRRNGRQGNITFTEEPAIAGYHRTGHKMQNIPAPTPYHKTVRGIPFVLVFRKNHGRKLPSETGEQLLFSLKPYIRRPEVG